MSDSTSRLEQLWNGLRQHAAVRAAAVYGGASWFLIEVVSTLGAPHRVTRALAVLFAAGGVVVVALLLYLARSHTGSRGQVKRVDLAERAPFHFRMLTGRRSVVSTLVFVVLAGVLWLGGRRVLGAPVLPGADVIAVIPFATSGLGTVEYGEGLVYLLTPALDQVGGIRAIHAASVIRRWEATGSDLPARDVATRVGRELGAGSVLLGSITAVGADLQLTAELYRVSGELLARAQAAGRADDLLATVDTLGMRLLREIWRAESPVPHLRIAAITTSSRPAIGAYIEGERLFRNAAWDSAAARFEQAVLHDSLFALAWLRLLQTRSWATAGIGEDPRAPDLTHRVERLLARLPERERSLAVTRLLYHQGDLVGIDSARSLAGRYPDDPDAWIVLSEFLVHSASVAPAPADSLRHALAEAHRLDPSNAEPLYHLMQVQAESRDSAGLHESLRAARATGARWLEAHGGVHLLHYAPEDSIPRAVAAIVRRFAPELAELQLRSLAREIVEFIQIRFLGRPDATVDVLFAAFDSLHAALPQPARQLPAELPLRVWTLFQLGRSSDALAVLDGGSAANSSAADDELRTGLLMRADATGMLSPRLAPLLDASPSVRSSVRLQLMARMRHLARGDTAAALAVGVPAGADSADDRRIREFLHVEDARMWLLRGDTTRAIDLFRRGIREAPFTDPGYFQFLALFDFAVALSRRADMRAEGIRWLELYARRGPAVPARFALGEAREADGDIAGAVQEYRHVLRLLERADPFLEPQRAAARRALQRLTGEPGGN